MVKTPQSAFPRPGGRGPRQGRGAWRADCREARCEPAHRERTLEGIVASGVGKRQARQAVDVLQARRGAYRETEDGHAREDMKVAVRFTPSRARTPLRSRCRNAGRS